MAITPGLLKKLPITSSVVYLLFGLLVGSHGLNVIKLNSMEQIKLIEIISELTVIISLFTVGLKLKLKLSDPLWILPLSLATFSMVITVGLIALTAHQLLGLDIGESILLGAVLSPTDPVLASEVQLRHPEERNTMKFILTSEGGMNDGTAFPLVMLGLGLILTEGSSFEIAEWIKKDVIWAVFAGISCGILSGIFISKITSHVKEVRKSFYLEDFLAIASISLSYGIALQLHAYGFLAVFANALTIRQIEIRKYRFQAEKPKDQIPDNILSFNEQLEHIFEVVSVGVVGLLIDLASFSWISLTMALSVILIIRPIAVFIGTARSNLDIKAKAFLSWFGVRGIGSIYYLYFALNHDGLIEDRKSLINNTLWTILVSIFLHGISAKLILRNFGETPMEKPI